MELGQDEVKHVRSREYDFDTPKLRKEAMTAAKARTVTSKHSVEALGR